MTAGSALRKWRLIMWRIILSMIVATMLAPSVSFAQETEEETFQSIAKGLQSVQHALSPGGRATTSIGEKVVVNYAAPVFTKAASGSASGMMLAPNTQVEYQGSENGFAKVVPLTSNWNKGPIYLNSFMISNISNPLDEGIKRIGNLAKQLENNPYVRLKGFNVTVAIPPAIQRETTR
jgi:hypothetical protein